MLSSISPFQDDREDVSYHVDLDFLGYEMGKVDYPENVKGGGI